MKPLLSATEQKSRTLQRFSELIVSFIAELDERDGRITLGEVVASLRTRAYGVLFILFALPNVLPMIPGTSTVLGLPILYLSLQMLWGKHFPILPKFLRDKTLPSQTVRTVLQKSLPTLVFIEKQLKPRLRWLVLGKGQFFIAATVVFNVVMLIIPIPFSAILPAICIVLFGLSLLERDGLLAFFAYLMTIVTASVVILSTSAITILAYLGLKSVFGL